MPMSPSKGGKEGSSLSPEQVEEIKEVGALPSPRASRAPPAQHRHTRAAS